MALTMMRLGSFTFEVGVTGYDKLKKSWHSNIAEIPRNDNIDALQFRGTKNQTLTIEGAIFPRNSNISQDIIENLQHSRGQAMALTTGKYEFLGYFYIKSIAISSDHIIAQNVEQQQNYTIQLIKKPSPTLWSLLS